MKNNIAIDTFEAFHSLMHLYRAKMHKTLKKNENVLTHMEHKALGFFSDHEGATLSDLVAHSQKDKAQLNRLLRGLKEKGLIEEQKDAQDKRRIQLTITPAGRAIHATFKEESKEICQAAVDGLSIEEIDSLMQIINRIKNNLEHLPDE